MGSPISGKPGVIGPLGDGSPAEVGVDAFGSLLVAEKGPKYLEWLMRGYIFVAQTGTAAEVPKNDALTNSPSLWNPAGSEKLVVPLRVTAATTAEGTVIIHTFTLSYLASAGSSVLTGAPVATWTNIPGVNCLIGSGYAAKTKFAHGTCTYTANPTILMGLDFGLWTDGTPVNSQPVSGASYDFDGELGLPPGALISMGATAASSTTYVISVVWAELPLPAGL